MTFGYPEQTLRLPPGGVTALVGLPLSRKDGVHGTLGSARYGKDHYRITAWALDCAERVLPIFEAHRPGDFRPRRAVDIGRAWLPGRSR
jgi:hypothetical protein